MTTGGWVSKCQTCKSRGHCDLKLYVKATLGETIEEGNISNLINKPNTMCRTCGYLHNVPFKYKARCVYSLNHNVL